MQCPHLQNLKKTRLESEELKKTEFRRSLPWSVFIEVGNHTFLAHQHQVLPDDCRPAFNPIYCHVIQPLQEIATHLHDPSYVKQDTVKSVSKQNLANFHLNFSRFACVCIPDITSRVMYAITCMTYNMHLEEARCLIPPSHENNKFVRQLNQRTRQKINKSLVIVENLFSIHTNSYHILFLL
jgi:hypothetical protein